MIVVISPGFVAERMTDDGGIRSKALARAAHTAHIRPPYPPAFALEFTYNYASELSWQWSWRFGLPDTAPPQLRGACATLFLPRPANTIYSVVDLDSHVELERYLGLFVG